MAKFTYSEAENITRAADALTNGDLNKFVARLVEYINSKDNGFRIVTRGITGDDFTDHIEVYAWFYRFFVSE